MVEPKGRGCVVVAAGSCDVEGSVVVRYSSLPIVFTGFVTLPAGSVLVIRRRLVHRARSRKLFTGCAFAST